MPEVTDFEALDGLDIGHATSPLGSGGMRSKVVAAEMATAAGIPAVIASGLAPGTILAAAAGEPIGTRFEAREGRYSSFKLWLQLRQADPRAGARRRRRRAGAARGRHQPAPGRRSSTSRATSTPGDAVEIAHDGEAVGKGICNYSADELRQVRGLKSRGRPRAASRAPPRRPSTATTSC